MAPWSKEKKEGFSAEGEERGRLAVNRKTEGGGDLLVVCLFRRPSVQVFLVEPKLRVLGFRNRDHS
jgi:hypothetical protein